MLQAADASWGGVNFETWEALIPYIAAHPKMPETTRIFVDFWEGNPYKLTIIFHGCWVRGGRIQSILLSDWKRGRKFGEAPGNWIGVEPTICRVLIYI